METTRAGPPGDLNESLLPFVVRIVSALIAVKLALGLNPVGELSSPTLFLYPRLGTEKDGKDGVHGAR